MARELRFLALLVSAVCACGGQTFISEDAGGGEGGSSSSSSSGGSSSSSGGSTGSSGGGSGGSSSGSGSSSGGSTGSSGGSSGGSSSSSGGIMRVPRNHRPDDSECATTPPPGTCNFGSSGGPGMCSNDAQCDDAGVNGRCVEMGGGIAYCGCTYDACMHDSDCTGQTCACHGSPYMGSLGNTCVPGNCHVDADCGAGGYCSPSYTGNGCGGLGGYYCHTPGDQCIDDTDCTPSFQVCAYSMMTNRWECATQVACALE